MTDPEIITIGGKEEFAANCDPFVPPHFRLNLAKQIANGEIDDPGEMSPALTAAMAHLSSDTRIRNDSPAIAAAIRLHDEDSPTRWATEAWLLAGLDNQQISDRVDVPPDVVEVYERLCFSVRDNLMSNDWIAGKVIGWKHLEGFKNDDVREFWLWAGWSGGPIIVDALVELLQESINQDVRPTLNLYLREHSRMSVEFQGLLASTVLPRVGIGQEWSVEFGIQFWETQDANNPQTALEKVRASVIGVARCLLLGTPLPQLPRRKKGRRAASYEKLVTNLTQIVMQDQSSARRSMQQTSRIPQSVTL